MRLVLSQKGWCKMSGIKRQIKELQDKVKLQRDELEPRRAELEKILRTAHQNLRNAEEAERTCFSALLELKKQNREFLQEKLMEQLDYQQRSDQIEDEISMLTRRLKFIDSTIVFRSKYEFSRVDSLKTERETLVNKIDALKEEKNNLDAGHEREMMKYRVSPECDLSKKHLDLIEVTNGASKRFHEVLDEIETLRYTFNALNNAFSELDKVFELGVADF